jgi:signal transduction histidine kinase
VFALRTVCPLLIQDATQERRYRRHPGVRAGLTRYLGIPIRTPEGEPIGTLCILDGHSDEILGEEDSRFLSLLAMRVSAEVERERLTQARIAEHRATAEHLADLNRRLESTAEEKRKFVAMIIHDLRQPLTALNTILYLLESERDPQERAACLEALQNRVGALAGLLDALCEVNQIEAGQVRLHLEQVDLAQVIRECIENVTPAFVSGPVRVLCDLDDSLGLCRVDKSKLTHILLNLLSNALKFTSRGYVRVVAATEGAERWFFEIEDTGIGMSLEEQQRVFEEFYRTPSASASGQYGSGLGLAIVRQLCQTMQAEITLRSAPGQGSCFRVTFPRQLRQEE